MPRRLPILLLLLAAVAFGATQRQPTLAQIAHEVDEGNGDAMEHVLLQLHESEPGDAEVMTQLARIEYLRATSKRSQPVSGFPMNWDGEHMAAAERWAKQAVAANPRHANAWVAYGQIKNAQMQPRESLEMLERAESLDPSNSKLRLRKGATYRALAASEGDPSFLQSAAREFSLVIDGPVDSGAERLAAQQLGQLYGSLGDHEKALQILSSSLETSQGSERAFLLDDRAKVYLDAGQVDLALADSREALEIIDFGVGRWTLACGLLVKAGLVVRDGNAADAAAIVQQFEETRISPMEIVPLLASKPGTFAATYALLAPDLKARGGDRIATNALGQAAGFISPADIGRLQALGVDIDHVDGDGFTLLHHAIRADNIDAVRTLLDLGADISDRDHLLNTALVGSSPRRQEIRRLVMSKLGVAEASGNRVAGMPIPGRWYHAERSIGEAGDPGGKIVQAGMTLLAANECTSIRPATLCLAFFTRPGVFFGTVSLPLSKAGDLTGLREVPAPNGPEVQGNKAN